MAALAPCTFMSNFLKGLDGDSPVRLGFCAPEQGLLQTIHVTPPLHWMWMFFFNFRSISSYFTAVTMIMIPNQQ
jgi:hypothetical protein